MSAAVDTYRDEMEATYAVDFSRGREPNKARSRFPEYRRRGGAHLCARPRRHGVVLGNKRRRTIGRLIR